VGPGQCPEVPACATISHQPAGLPHPEDHRMTTEILPAAPAVAS
jgi:hypothetical protein